MIELHDPDGTAVARGIAQYDSVEVRRRLRERAAGVENGGQGRPLVHADDLVAV